MLKRILAIFKKATPVAPALTPYFWYGVTQPGEPAYLVIVLDREQREASRYWVWVN
jgi:hypothetical protein